MGQVGQAFDHIAQKEDIKGLSAVLYADSFFCGYWAEENLLLKAESLPVAELKSHLDRWTQDFPGVPVHILSSTIPFVHVPSDMYEPEHFKTYFEGLYDLRKRHDYSGEQDRFSRLPVSTLHFIPGNIKAVPLQNIEGIKMQHISTAMSNYAYLSGTDCVIFMQEHMMHICCHREGQFLFYNQFYCSDVNDYLYFSLLVLQHFNVPYQDTEVHLGGEIDRVSKIYIKLRTYIPKLRVMDELVQTQSPTGSPLQLYFDLFLARACVS